MLRRKSKGVGVLASVGFGATHSAAPKRCVAAVVQNIWKSLSLAADGTITVQTCLKFFIPEKAFQTRYALVPDVPKPGGVACEFEASFHAFRCSRVGRQGRQGTSTHWRLEVHVLYERASVQHGPGSGSDYEPPNHVLTADLSAPYASDAIRLVVRLR